MLNSPSTAIYVSEQVCIGWHRTGAYYIAKLTFSHNLPVKVWGAYYTSVRTIFKFLWYIHNVLQWLAQHQGTVSPINSPSMRWL